MKYLNTFGLLTLLLLVSCSTVTNENPPDSEEEVAVLSAEEMRDRGEYLVTLAGCDHCHSPKEMTPQGPAPIMDLWMSGYPADRPLPQIDPSEVSPGKWVLMTGDLTAGVGPWGVSFASNLTPAESGIGSWTFEQFQTSLVEGRYKGHKEGRMLLPPMPWQSIGKMAEEDMRAIYEYLMSLPAVDNVVPNHIPPDQLAAASK